MQTVQQKDARKVLLRSGSADGSRKPCEPRMNRKPKGYCSLVNWIQAGPGGAAAKAQYSVAAPSQPLANVPIQYGLIIKILDMSFDCKHDRQLQIIHS